MMKIVTADERAAEKGGVKAVIAGPYGIGKTSLLRTLDPTNTLFVDGEAGDLSVSDVHIDSVRPATWPDCRDLAAFIGGPNLALPSHAPYSQDHFEAVSKNFNPDMMKKYETVFVDSLTKLSRLCLQWAAQQPDAFNAQGKQDLRGAYGLLGREMIGFVTQLQHARSLNIIFTCAMEQSKDDYGRMAWDLHIEGSKTGRELPGIVDEVISYILIDFGDGVMTRSFVTNKDNEHAVPAKDRSGRLDPIEEPHLGKLIAKASDQSRNRAGIKTDLPAEAI